MAYYQDVRILIYVKRGAYTARQTERNVEKYQMLRVLLATTFRDLDLNIRTLCRDYTMTWHDDHCALEIDMPRARWERRFSEVAEIELALKEMGGFDHNYCVEFVVIDQDNLRNIHKYQSHLVKVPLLSIEVKSKVNL